MKPSTLNLTNTLEFIPRVLRGRYQDDSFGKKKANAVLADMEKKLDAEYYKAEYPLILKEGITDYPIDNEIRHIRGLYVVNSGDIIPDKDNPIDFEIIGKDLRLNRIPIVNTEGDIGGPVAVWTAAQKCAFDLDSSFPDWPEEGQLRGGMCVFNDLSLGATKNRIVIDNEGPTDANYFVTISLNGDLDELSSDGDTFNVYMNYYLIDALRYITKLTDVGDVIDIPVDWEDAFIAGLRYYYENQSDQESKKARRAGEEYRRLLDDLASDEKRKIGTQPKPKPRSMPDIGSHGYSDTYYNA